MPSENDTFRLSITNAIGTVDPEQTGPNHIWDFSFLIPVSQRIDTFHSVSSTPFAYQFYFNNLILYPDHYSNYATRIDPPPTFASGIQVEDAYYFFKNSSNEYSQTGFGAKLNSIPISQRYSPVDVIYEFPLNYGNTSISDAEFGLSVPNLGYYGQSIHRENTVDGWGMLTTPFGTFQTLRVKTVLNIVDTVYLDTIGTGSNIPRPTQIEYKWLGNGQGVPLLQINADELLGVPVINTIMYRDSVRNDLIPSISVEESIISSLQFTVFPNPNNGVFELKFANSELKILNFEIKIYNVLGERIKPTFQTINSKLEIDISSEPKGIYFVKAKYGNEIFVKRLIFL
ncbi:MAG: hypothetical protein COA57_11535 [Flavobacteriales bacterium]|nr:MAG: hypothetical protein COA57_11535 [Flavobacteriales bacterium]